MIIYDMILKFGVEDFSKIWDLIKEIDNNDK